MEPETRQPDILNYHRRIQHPKNQAQTLLVIGANAGLTSSFEKITQPLMGKTANHGPIVT